MSTGTPRPGPPNSGHRGGDFRGVLKQAANSSFCLSHESFANWTPGFSVSLQLTMTRTPSVYDRTHSGTWVSDLLSTSQYYIKPVSRLTQATEVSMLTWRPQMPRQDSFLTHRLFRSTQGKWMESPELLLRKCHSSVFKLEVAFTISSEDLPCVLWHWLNVCPAVKNTSLHFFSWFNIALNRIVCKSTKWVPFTDWKLWACLGLSDSLALSIMICKSFTLISESSISKGLIIFNYNRQFT